MRTEILASRSRGKTLVSRARSASVGGTELCLTCASCNSTSGTRFDGALAELIEYRRIAEAFQGEPSEISRPATLKAGGVSLNAEFIVKGGEHTIAVRESRNNPSLFAAQGAHLRTHGSGTEVEISVNFRMPSRSVFLSILRSGYLAAFALLGYRFVFNRALNMVRQQLAEPEEELIPHAAGNFVSSKDYDEFFVGRVEHPVPAIATFFPADAVVFPLPVVVILPFPNGADGFYPKWAAAYSSGAKRRSLDYTIVPMYAPTGPQMSLDFRDPA